MPLPRGALQRRPPLCFSCGGPTLAPLFSGVVLSWKSRVVSWSTGVIPRGVTCRPCSGGPPAAPRLCGRDAGAGRRVQVLRQGASALTAPVGPPCVSAAAPNRVLENGHTGETRLALRDPAREPAAPTPWLPVLSLTCSGQACRVSPSSQESGSSSGLRGHTCLHELSAQVRSAGWWGRTAGRASWGPDSSSLYTGDVPWEGPFTSQVRKEVARLQQRPFPLPHHKSSRPNDV